MIKDLLLACIVCLLMVTAKAYADTASITYVAPTEREDNTPLAPSEIGGFTVYDNEGVTVMQLPPDARGFDIPTTSVTQSLFITTTDTDGRESVYSQEATVPATIASPKSVTNIQVTVTP